MLSPRLSFVLLTSRPTSPSPSLSTPATTLRLDLRILAMSATLETDRMKEVVGHGEPAPVITSEGRTYPVDIRSRPAEHHGGQPPRIAEATAAAVQHALQHDGSDVLVFLAGRR